MIDDEKIAIRLLGGIDSYYFFIDNDVLNERLYRLIYENQIKNNDLEIENTEFLGYSGKESGFVGTWFRVDFGGSEEFPIPLFKVGFKSGDKQKNVNNIYVQLLGSGIYFLGFLGVLEYAQKWFTSLLGVNVSLEHFINSRVDVNCFIGGYDFSTINHKMFFSSFVKFDTIKTFGGANERLETLYLGARNAKYSFKIYDKRKELFKSLDKISNYIKVYFFKKHGFDFKTELWNAEFSLKREFLKEFKTSNAAELLDNFYTIYQYCFSKLRFLGYDIDKIERYKINNNLNKLKSEPIWDKILYNDTFSVKIKNSDIKRTVKRYLVDKENNAYKQISLIMTKLVLSGYKINYDRYLKIVNL